MSNIEEQDGGAGYAQGGEFLAGPITNAYWDRDRLNEQISAVAKKKAPAKKSPAKKAPAKKKPKPKPTSGQGCGGATQAPQATCPTTTCKPPSKAPC